MTAQRERKLEFRGTTVKTGVAQSDGPSPREKKIIRISWLPSNSEDESDVRSDLEQEIGESQVSEMYLKGWNPKSEGENGDF